MIMQDVTAGFSPASVLAYFEQICKIPHGSGNEGGIADYLQSFANLRGLYCYRDAKNNVFIKREATEKYRNSPAILLQGHTDMVCERVSTSTHDFERDGLDLYVENGLLRARGTTLGGDDGIAVAMMLALLDGELEEHPTLECLFTVEEETGLGGAEAFDYKRISARRMINLDSEDEREMVAGCAGGVRTDVAYAPERESVSGELMTVSVDGLFGGHSGVDINCGRANAVSLAIDLIKSIRAVGEVKLVSLVGGDKDNAIPRSCKAVMFVEDAEAARAAVREAENEIRRGLCDEDRGMTVSVSTSEAEDSALSAPSTDALIAFLSGIRVGVIAMSEHLDGLVEFSRNLGVIRIDHSGAAITYSSRSAKSEQVDLSIEQVKEGARPLGARVTCRGRYPGWDFAPESPLRELYASKYREIMGKEIATVVIHAGLECGIISSRLPDMDIISVGPDIYNIHTPDEALDMASADRVFRILKEVIVSSAEL